MEYRQLGNSGLKVSVLTMGTMTFGGKGNFAKVGNLAARRGAQADRHRRRRRRQSDRHRQCLFGRRLGGTDRRGDGAQAQARHADRDQGALSDGGGAERSRTLALASHPRMRGEPQAAAHRCHRPLSGASVGRADAARGDDGGARQSRALGQGALRRLFQLVRLAHDEGDGGRAPRRPHPLRVGADSLHAPGARSRIRTHSHRPRPEARCPGLEPDRRGSSVGQASPQQDCAEGSRVSGGLGRAAGSRRERAVGASSTNWSRSARRTASPARRSRLRGCSAGRR